jgi:hypothetical protein
MARRGCRDWNGQESSAGGAARDPPDDDECYCRDLTKDAAAGRFGSRLGDAAVEVLRGQQHQASDGGPPRVGAEES